MSLNGSYTLIKGRCSKRIKEKQVKERGNDCRERRYTAVIRGIGAVQRASRSRSAAWPCEDGEGGGGRDVVGGGGVDCRCCCRLAGSELSADHGQFPLEQGF